MKRIALAAALTLTTALSTWADSPRIVDASARKSAMGWRIEVTLEHPDSGWDHYASGWEVLDQDGNRAAFRELAHPHVTEQPFTRSLSSVMLPDGTRKVFIVAHCSNGDKSAPYPVELSFHH
ncbi:hypothetical protein [Pseudooceanicola aestuarii]|uniref:hypothetical protein n=1 Tax=Pseudooceanicola aestuarii TaxID=2697319 RepID=UPI0013D64698|nr:hypothetical protein [Pseudooceanicola aestuarii]